MENSGIKQEVIFLARRNETVRVKNNKTTTYTEEYVLRGYWDGEKAVLQEKYDPRGLKTTVYQKERLIFI